jgi:hypothetical protein
MCLNCPLTFYLLGNCVNWVIDLFLTSLVCMCRILERAKHLGPGVELGNCLSFHPYTFHPWCLCCCRSITVISCSLAFASWSCICVSVTSFSFKGLLGSVSNKSFDCISCQLGKQPALPFNNSESIASASFDLIHSDVWGPSPILSMSGSCYFVIFVDDSSRYT